MKSVLFALREYGQLIDAKDAEITRLESLIRELRADRETLRERLYNLETAATGALPCIHDDLVRNTLSLAASEARSALLSPNPHEEVTDG